MSYASQVPNLPSIKDKLQAQNKQLALLVLAAGSSSRLGQAKQCLTFQGKRLLTKQCQLALTFSKEVYCVLGYKAHAILSTVEKEVIESVGFINNTDWQLGLGASIHAGVSRLPSDIDAVMILLVDQWQLNEEHLTTLIEHWLTQPEKIIAATMQKNIAKHNEESSDESCKKGNEKGSNKKTVFGPPIIFPKSFFADLIACKAEQGAKQVVKKHLENTVMVELPPAFVDVDTPEQLAVMLNAQ